MELGVELGHDAAAADRVGVIVDADHFRAGRVGAVQVDRHDVSVDGRPVDRLELGVVLAQAIELPVDLPVIHRERGQCDLQTVVAGDGDGGRTWTTASKTTPPASLPCVISISGCAMGSSSVSTTARA